MMSEPAVHASDSIDALRRRDEDAWRSFHDAEFPALYRFAVALGGDEDVAEECVNESFARLLRALPRARFADRLELRRWLFVVCRNLVRDRHHEHAPAALDETREPAAPDLADQLHARLALTRALATLPETQREVLVLRFVVGLPTVEVATRSGRGVKAVESLQHRGLVALRRSLALEGYRP